MMAQTPPGTGLPSSGIKRWGTRRKAAVLAAVQRGSITLEEACHRYQMSEEEFFSWQRAFEEYGIKGLRATRVQRRRDRRSSPLARTESASAGERQQDPITAVAIET